MVICTNQNMQSCLSKYKCGCVWRIGTDGLGSFTNTAGCPL